MTTTVLLKPHLAKFITALYGAPASIPFNDEIYHDFLTSLSKEYKPPVEPSEKTEWVPVKFEIPIRNVNHLGHTFDDKMQFFFNQKLAKRFNHNCFVFINYLVHNCGMSRRQAIYKVIERFDLAFVLEYETLKSSYSRREKEVQEIFNGFLPTKRTRFKPKTLN